MKPLGAAFLASTASTATVAALILLPPALLILPFSPNTYHRWTNGVAAMWFRLVVWLIEVAGGVRFVFTGDKLQAEPALLMSNHRTRLDWMLLWSLFARAGTLHMLRIVLKASLKKAPAFGFVMQTLGFLFLQRDWAKDEPHMIGMLDTYAAGDPTQLLIFPEGTDLSESNLKKSHEHAEKFGLPKYQHVLHPRTKGFALCHRHLKDSIKAVYDVTLGFPDSVPQNEKVILEATWPKEVHVHVRRVPIAEVPSDIEAWVAQRFKDKEARLIQFEHDKAFRDTETSCSGAGYGAAPGLHVALAVWALVCWAFFNLLWSYGWVWRLCGFTTVMQVVLTVLGGADKLEVWLHQREAASKLEIGKAK